MSESVSQHGPVNPHSQKLTANGQLHKQNDADLETDDIEDEVAEVVRSDTVVDPWTMAFEGFVSRSTGNRYFGTYWSCFATHRPHRRQCLLRSGFRDMQGTQKFSSSNFHSSKSCLTISLCWFLLLIFGT